MLLADQCRPQHVMDAAVEDRDAPAVDGLGVDDPREVGARLADQEPSRLQQQARVRAATGRRPSSRPAPRARDPAARGRAPPRAARTGSRARRRRRRSGPARRPTDASSAAVARRRGDVRDERVRVERRSRRRTRAARAARGGATRPPAAAASSRSAASIPNLPAPSSPMSRTRSSRAASVTAARRSTGWRRPASARSAPAGRARRATRRSRPGCRASTAAASSSSRLPGPGHDDRGRGSIPARSDGRELTARRHVGPEPRPAEVGDDGERRVGLDRVGQLDPRRQDAARSSTT